LAGDRDRCKTIAVELAKDADLSACQDIGGKNKFRLVEQFTWFWINLALFRVQGGVIGNKLMRRQYKIAKLAVLITRVVG
jgi:hypothetical protein